MHASGTMRFDHTEIVRFVRDQSWQRFGRVVVAGSPLTIFRTSAAADSILDALESDVDVDVDVRTNRLIERLVHAGAIHPHFADEPSSDLSSETHRFTVDDVTIVTPQLGGAAARDGRITVDDGSTPPIPAAGIRLEENRGPAAARNAARPAITTALIAFVDADVELFDDFGVRSWLVPLLPHFDDDRVGLVAPRVDGEPGSPLDLGESPARIRAGTRVSYVPGAAIVVRTAAFDAVGGFDEGLRFGEDVDFVWRLDDAGWGCRYEPTSRVWHQPRQHVAGRMVQNAGYGTSAAPLAVRHPNSLSPIHTNGWTVSAWSLAILGHPMSGAAVAVGSAAALIPKLPDLPPLVSFKLAMTGHAKAAQQYAAAVRRVWWPLALVAALFSKRARFVVLAAVVCDVDATSNDVAYGWGLWKGMIEHRTCRPIIPRISSWPGDRSSSD